VRVGVEVVGRLVEQEHFGLERERGAQLPAAAFTRRQRRPALELQRVEAKAAVETARDSIALPGECLDSGLEQLDALPAEGDAKLLLDAARRRRPLLPTPFAPTSPVQPGVS
jgi:hypothetical protein